MDINVKYKYNGGYFAEVSVLSQNIDIKTIISSTLNWVHLEEQINELLDVIYYHDNEYKNTNVYLFSYIVTNPRGNPLMQKYIAENPNHNLIPLVITNTLKGFDLNVPLNSIKGIVKFSRVYNDNIFHLITTPHKKVFDFYVNTARKMNTTENSLVHRYIGNTCDNGDSFQNWFYLIGMIMDGGVCVK